MSAERKHPRRHFVTAGDLTNILQVVYVHKKTENEGDIYLTRHGHPHGELLDIENWYEPEWFAANRVRLLGTSYVYRVPTKTVDGKSLKLVVKYSRVGEDVPMNTHQLAQFLDTEFNSPWEEFMLVMEMREGTFGPADLRLRVQRPLAIYVPPEPMQFWQTGRSRSRISNIISKHQGLSLDILRQYILVYEWIDGLNIVEAFESFGCKGDELNALLHPLTLKVIDDMAAKGFAVADMKPSHIIIGEERMKQINAAGEGEAARATKVAAVQEAVEKKDYSVVDYELMLRTPPHEEQIKKTRRHTYLDAQRDRFKQWPMPSHLKRVEVFGVPYVRGFAESTGGHLWVVGRNPRLFDYFLPERWRRTPCRPLSSHHEIYYTLTKDNIRLVWKTSRVGEMPGADEAPERIEAIRERGFNSPFEVAAIAQTLSDGGLPTIYMRAIYMTGSEKIEPVTDPRRYESHSGLFSLDGHPLLREDRNYVTIRGYYNGPDDWVASHENQQLYRPFDLRAAAESGLLPHEDCDRLFQRTLAKITNLGYDGSLLELNDLLIAIDPAGQIVLDAERQPEARVCNFELVYKI